MKKLSIIFLALLFLCACKQEELELPYNQFDGIGDRAVVVPDSFAYTSNDVYIYFHLDETTLDDISRFEKVKLYMKGHGYIGRYTNPNSGVITHPNVPADTIITYQLSLGCSGCTESGLSEIEVSTY